jgi:hypothetical protein
MEYLRAGLTWGINIYNGRFDIVLSNIDLFWATVRMRVSVLCVHFCQEDPDPEEGANVVPA